MINFISHSKELIKNKYIMFKNDDTNQGSQADGPVTGGGSNPKPKDKD